MAHPYPLSPELLASLLDAESLRRAQAYVRRGALRELKQFDGALRGLCEGSRAEPYRIQVEFEGGAPEATGIRYAHCTCPVGEEGRCKHVAALLLVWNESPQQFSPMLDLETLLQERSATELRAMLRYVLGRDPDLEDLLQMPFPNPHAQESGPVDLTGYRYQVRDMFRDHQRRGSASSQLADALSALVPLIQGFLNANQAPLGAQVLGVVAQEILEHLADWNDRGGFIDRLLANMFDQCEHMLKDQALTPDAQDALFEFVLGALSAQDSAPVTSKHAQFFVLGPSLEPEHRALLIGMMREALRTKGVEPAHSTLLFHLEAPLLDATEYLARCEALGLHRERIEYLLEHGRTQDALGILIREAQEDDVFLTMVEAFGEEERHALGKIVHARYTSTGSLPLLRWLANFATDTPEDMLALRQSYFFRSPNASSYDALRQTALSQGRWSLILPSVLGHLRDSGLSMLLVHAHVEESQFKEAASILEDAGHLSAQQLFQSNVHVANQAEEVAPKISIALYQRAATHLIEGRSLTNFKHAASLLAQARRLSEAQGEESTWLAYKEELLQKYGRFQGLSEALERVGV